MNTMNTFMKTMVYGALDVATIGRGIPRKIGGEKFRFPVRWSRCYPPDYKPDILAAIRAHCEAGQTVLDVGAYLGLFTVAMARRVGPTGGVFSFEPADHARAILEETLRLNRCDRIVTVCREAVSAVTTPVARFYDTGDPLSEGNGLIRTAPDCATTVVPTVSVDDFVARRRLGVPFLRIDVGGSELDVLRGARRTLLSCRPAVALSVYPHVPSRGEIALAEIWDLLATCHMTVLRRNRRLGREEFLQNTTPLDVELIPKD
ncbi:MAG: FkbM family methyltransferase [Planctomycetia bacterium]|nr:FkbM family methyltransferase [Planctomycetia bacterium]